MDYVEISNSMIVYLLCGITVAIAFVQAVLYIRMAKKMTVKANIPAKIFTSFAIIFILQIFLCWLYFDSLLIHELTYAIIIYLTKKSFKPSFRLSILLKMC